MTRPLCIYHAKCSDGYAAAWIVNRKLGGDVDFHEGYYNAPPPDVTGRDLLIVDFSYKRDVLTEMARVAKHTLVLDHHVSAQRDIGDLTEAPRWSTFQQVRVADSAPGVIYGTFDVSRSGAGLAWDYFHPGVERPPLVTLIELRDLWLRDHALWEEARLVHAYINSHPFTFDEWDRHHDALRDRGPRNRVLNEGGAILRQHDRDVEEMVGATSRRMRIGGHNVPVANLPPMLASDAGHLMSKGEPFSASYFDGPRGRMFSLRSADDGVDVSEIAKRYGGGGHQHASGFKVELGWAGDLT